MAKEGFKFLIPALVLSVIAFLIFTKTDSEVALYISVLVYLLALLLVISFRDPQRRIPPGEGLILSPADGKVRRIERSGDGSSQILSIFMSLLDVHINRVPVDGVVREVSYRRGRFVPAFTDKAAKSNERNIIVIENEHGNFIVKQIAGTLSRRIVCNLSPGQLVVKGERFGLIQFGSLVELVLPIWAELRVKENERVKAGETIVGVLRRE